MSDEKKNIVDLNAGKKIEAGEGRQLPTIKVQIKSPPVKPPKEAEKS